MKSVHVSVALAVATLSATPSQASAPTMRQTSTAAAPTNAVDDPPCNYIRVRCPSK